MALARVGDRRETGHSQIIPAIVGGEWRTREQRRGGDPGIGAFDPSSIRLGSYRHLRPFRAQLTIIWEDDKAFKVLLQSCPPRRSPTSFKCPAVQFRDRHERDDRDSVNQVGQVLSSDQMILEDIERPLIEAVVVVPGLLHFDLAKADSLGGLPNPNHCVDTRRRVRRDRNRQDSAPFAVGYCRTK